MAEQIVNGYKRLFEVRLLHHYWLDEGATLFDAIPDTAKKDRRLLTYDVRSFLTVAPTAATEQRLKGLRCVFKPTALGFVVAAPNGILLPDEAWFEFVLTVQSTDFFNYTALTLRKQKIYSLYHQPEDRTYRYKENVPVFSNLTGTSRGASPNLSLYLSREMSPLAATDQVEALILSGSALLQLTSDQPTPTTQQLGAVATNLPVFCHQGDSPMITPPAGLTGVPPQGIELTEGLPDDIFALIRIATLSTATKFSLLATPNLPAPAPSTLRSTVFQVRFKNRSTVWKYFNKNTGLPKPFAPNPLPLTHFGNAGTQQKPSAGLVKPAFDDLAAPAKVSGLVSEIFI